MFVLLSNNLCVLFEFWQLRYKFILNRWIKNNHTELLHKGMCINLVILRKWPIELLILFCFLLLCQAANGHEECCDALLGVCNSTIRDINGRSALHMAAACGHEGILGSLLQLEPTNHLDNKGYTPLHWACYNGELSVWIITVFCAKLATQFVSGRVGGRMQIHKSQTSIKN